MNKNFNQSVEKEEQIIRGKRIRKIREKELRLNKTDLAKQIGISSQFLHLVKNGKGNLSYRSIKLLRDLSGHSADYILFGLDDSVINQTKTFLHKYDEKELSAALDMINELVFVLGRR